MRAEHIFLVKMRGINSIHNIMMTLFNGKIYTFANTLQLCVYTGIAIDFYSVIG